MKLLGTFAVAAALLLPGLLDGKKVTPEWRKPFQLVAEMASCPNWLR